MGTRLSHKGGWLELSTRLWSNASVGVEGKRLHDYYGYWLVHT